MDGGASENEVFWPEGCSLYLCQSTFLVLSVGPLRGGEVDVHVLAVIWASW